MTKPKKAPVGESVFIYGTLLPGEVNHHLIKPLIADSVDASLDAVFVSYHVGESSQEFPMVITDKSLLRKLEDLVGYVPTTKVRGQLVQIKHPTLIADFLDGVEGITPLKGIESANTYKRAIVDVQADGEKRRAWCYVANPKKGLVDRIIGRLEKNAPDATSLVLNGDWFSYTRNMHRYSLNGRNDNPHPTFGVETEYELHCGEGGLGLSDIVDHAKGRVKGINILYEDPDTEQIRTHRFPKLRDLLRAGIFKSHQRLFPGRDSRIKYFMGPRKRPRSDPAADRDRPSYYHPERMLMPAGEIYIDGENSDRVDERELCLTTADNLTVRDRDVFGTKYLETAAFPSSVAPGFVTEVARQELRSRAFVAELFGQVRGLEARVNTGLVEDVDDGRLENISVSEFNGSGEKKEIKYDGPVIKRGNSMQYNIVVDSRIEVEGRVIPLELSKVKVDVLAEKYAPKDSEKRSKFIDDIARASMRAFGPLYTLFFTRSRSEIDAAHEEFKVRPGNRFEYRNEVIGNLEQYQAGVLLFNAATIALSRVIREKALKAACDETGKTSDKIRQKELNNAYSRLSIDEILDKSLPHLSNVEYERAGRREGYRVSEGQYCDKMRQNIDTEFEMNTPFGEATLNAKSLLRALFYVKPFNDVLREISTDSEYNLLEQYAKGEKQFEVENPNGELYVNDEYVAEQAENLGIENTDVSEIITDLQAPVGTWPRLYDDFFYDPEFSMRGETEDGKPVKVFISQDRARPTYLCGIPCEVDLQVDRERRIAKRGTLTMQNFRALLECRQLVAQETPIVEVYTAL